MYSRYVKMGEFLISANRDFLNIERIQTRAEQAYVAPITACHGCKPAKTFTEVV